MKFGPQSKVVSDKETSLLRNDDPDMPSTIRVKDQYGFQDSSDEIDPMRNKSVRYRTVVKRNPVQLSQTIDSRALKCAPIT